MEKTSYDYTRSSCELIGIVPSLLILLPVVHTSTFCNFEFQKSSDGRRCSLMGVESASVGLDSVEIAARPAPQAAAL